MNGNNISNLADPVEPQDAVTLSYFENIVAGDGFYYADESTVHISGGTFSIHTGYTGQTSIVTLGSVTTGTWNGTTIAVARGGTGAITVAGARTNLGIDAIDTCITLHTNHLIYLDTSVTIQNAHLTYLDTSVTQHTASLNSIMSSLGVNDNSLINLDSRITALDVSSISYAALIDTFTNKVVITQGDGSLTLSSGSVVYIDGVTSAVDITLPTADAGITAKLIFGTNDASSSITLYGSTLSYNDITLATELFWPHIPIAFPRGQFMECYAVSGAWVITPRGPVEPNIDEILPTVTSNAFVTTYSNINYPQVTFTGAVTSVGNSEVTDRGLVWSRTTPSVPTLSNNKVSCGAGLGTYMATVTDPAYNTGSSIYARAYATNLEGTSYGNVMSLVPHICLAKGTLVTLSDLTRKPIEEVTYSDLLLVWDFDQGVMAYARPLWIKMEETAPGYNLLTFSDGTELKTISQHRIFNKEAGKFTYPMTEETPIGSSTYKESGEYVTLTQKDEVQESVLYYNVITEYHINLFANGILTSCRYSNIYPIEDMKYVKETRPAIGSELFTSVPAQYYKGLRLVEQKIPVEDSINYINRLEYLKNENIVS